MMKTVRAKYLAYCYPYVFIAGLAFFMFRGIFNTGFMSGFDNSLHYYDLHYLTRTLIPTYHWISGWSMQGMAGIPIFVDYFQLGFMIVAALHKLLFLPLNFSYKAMVFISYFALGAGFYKVCSYRFGKISALLISMCLMLQKDIYLDRILGGIWNNYLGIGLLFVFVHLLDRDIESITPRKAGLLGLVLGLLILTHLFAGIFGVLIFIIYIAPYLFGASGSKLIRNKLLILLRIPLLAFMISSFYLYGFIAARGYFSSFPSKDIASGIGWGLKSFFSPLEKGTGRISTIFLNTPVMIRIIFSICGLYFFTIREKNSNIKRFLRCILIFMALSLVLFSDILPNVFGFWRRIPFVGTLQTNRFLVYVHIGAYFFAAYGVSRFLGYFRKRKVAIALLLMPILISSIFHYRLHARPGSMTLDESPNMNDVYEVWNWLDRHVKPQDGRVVYQDTFGNIDDPILKRSDVFNLSGVFTDIPQIGVSRPASPFPQERFMRNDQGRMFNREIDTIGPDFIKNMMSYFNAGYAISVEPRLETLLERSDFFVRKEKFGKFSIYKLKDFKSDLLKFEINAEYRIDRLEAQHMVFSIANGAGNREVFIRVAYHPFWSALLDGKPVRIERDRYSLMKIALPGDGNYKLDLKFNSFHLFWVALSALALLYCTIRSVL